MGSTYEGKSEAIDWIKEHFKKGDTCLDIGACDGKWADLLKGYFVIDAIEIFEPNIEKHKLKQKYRNVFCIDAAKLKYDYYDCIILGDVIEHMTIDQAFTVLEYAKTHCKDLVAAIPYLDKQGPIYGNKWEIHIQDDLTPEIVDQRYPGLEIIWSNNHYAYYHKKGKIL